MSETTSGNKNQASQSGQSKENDKDSGSQNRSSSQPGGSTEQHREAGKQSHKND